MLFSKRLCRQSKIVEQLELQQKAKWLPMKLELSRNLWKKNRIKLGRRFAAEPLFVSLFHSLYVPFR
jgi:hypothetical protein